MADSFLPTQQESETPTPMATDSSQFPRPTLIFMTDFGDLDPFVGTMKGAFLKTFRSAIPEAHTVCPPLLDLTHHIRRHDIAQGAWVLGTHARHFPPGSIFVAVVDPKVGEREQAKLLAYEPTQQQFYLAPDNGLLTLTETASAGALICRQIENTALFHQPAPVQGLAHAGAPASPNTPSLTFHGRDIYASVAAHLAAAVITNTLTDFFESVGPQASTIKRLELPQPTRKQTAHGEFVEGTILRIDRFGNLITNIPHQWLDGVTHPEIQIFSHQWRAQYLETYAQGEGLDQIFLVPGSENTVELCLYEKNAAKVLEAEEGNLISIRWE